MALRDPRLPSSLIRAKISTASKSKRSLWSIQILPPQHDPIHFPSPPTPPFDMERRDAAPVRLESTVASESTVLKVCSCRWRRSIVKHGSVAVAATASRLRRAGRRARSGSLAPRCGLPGPRRWSPPLGWWRGGAPPARWCGPS